MKNTDEALSKLILKGIELAEKSGRFVLEQAPELIQQFYIWHICQHTMVILLGLIILITGYKTTKACASKEESWEYEFKIFDKYFGFGGILILAFTTIIGFLFLFIGIFNLVFILTAPKLYLIEYFIK